MYVFLNRLEGGVGLLLKLELCKQLIERATKQNQRLTHRDFHSRNLMLTQSDELAVIDRGRVAVSGSLEDLRRAAETNDAGLEEVFLKITRGATGNEITAVLGDLE